MEKFRKNPELVKAEQWLGTEKQTKKLEQPNGTKGTTLKRPLDCP